MHRNPAKIMFGLRGILLLFALTAGLAPAGRAALGADIYSADAVKAAFLYRFAAYVTWPPRTLHDDRSFTIAVLDSDPVAQELERILTGRVVNGLPARVRRIRAVRELGDAQMLYIGAGSLYRLTEEIDSIGSQPVLVVTDAPGGLNAGSTVNFMLVDRRVRFEVSIAAADRARLKVSAELLSVAARVEGDHRRSDNSCTRLAPYDTRCPARLG